jgi:hypothetical protein
MILPADMIETHPAPTPANEMGYSVEVFNALNDNLAVLTLPESHFEARRATKF